MKTKDFILHTDNVVELERYISNLSSREEILRALKLVNELKAKNKNYSDNERLDYAELITKYIDFINHADLSANIIKTLNILQNPNDTRLSEISKQNSIIGMISKQCQQCLNFIKERRN